MPTLHLRPFVKVVDNIAGALGDATKGEFDGVMPLGEQPIAANASRCEGAFATGKDCRKEPRRRRMGSQANVTFEKSKHLDSNA